MAYCLAAFARERVTALQEARESSSVAKLGAVVAVRDAAVGRPEAAEALVMEGAVEALCDLLGEALDAWSVVDDTRLGIVDADLEDAAAATAAALGILAFRSECRAPETKISRVSDTLTRTVLSGPRSAVRNAARAASCLIAGAGTSAELFETRRALTSTFREPAVTAVLIRLVRDHSCGVSACCAYILMEIASDLETASTLHSLGAIDALITLIGDCPLARCSLPAFIAVTAIVNQTPHLPGPQLSETVMGFILDRPGVRISWHVTRDFRSYLCQLYSKGALGCGEFLATVAAGSSCPPCRGHYERLVAPRDNFAAARNETILEPITGKEMTAAAVERMKSCGRMRQKVSILEGFESWRYAHNDSRRFGNTDSGRDGPRLPHGSMEVAVVSISKLVRQKGSSALSAEALRLLARLVQSSPSLQKLACEHDAIRTLAAILLAPNAEAGTYDRSTRFCNDMLEAAYKCLSCLCLSQGASRDERDLLSHVLPKAVDAMNHANLMVASAALTCFTVLGRLHLRLEPSDLINIARGPLMRLLQTDSSDVRRRASLCLATITTKLRRRERTISRDVLSACMNLLRSEDRVLAANGLSTLESVLSGASDDLKEQVAKGVGDELMTSLCRSDDVEVRLRALHFRISVASPASYIAIEALIDGCFNETQESRQQYMSTIFGQSYATEMA